MQLTLTQAYSYCQLGDRRNQEDSRYPDSDRPAPSTRCFVVCDGVGGSAAGEVAAGEVTRTLGRCLDRMLADTGTPFTHARLQEAFDAAWDALNCEYRRRPVDMATTVVLAVAHSDGLTIAHMGDSRAYLIRPADQVVYRTDDHTVVNSMVHSGMLTPEQALTHPQRNVITRYMGPLADDQMRSMATVITLTDLRAGDYLLLCTDGVTDVLTDSQLLAIVANPELTDEQKISEMAERTAGSPDNNTAVLVGIAGVEPTPEADQLPASGTETAPIDNPQPGATDIHTTAVNRRRKSLFSRLISLLH